VETRTRSTGRREEEKAALESLDTSLCLSLQIAYLILQTKENSHLTRPAHVDGQKQWSSSLDSKAIPSVRSRLCKLEEVDGEARGTFTGNRQLQYETKVFTQKVRSGLTQCYFRSWRRDPLSKCFRQRRRFPVDVERTEREKQA
jgi:hypothetical protein